MPIEVAHVLQELAARGKRMTPTPEQLAELELVVAETALPESAIFAEEIELLHQIADTYTVMPPEDPPKKAKKEKVKNNG